MYVACIEVTITNFESNYWNSLSRTVRGKLKIPPRVFNTYFHWKSVALASSGDILCRCVRFLVSIVPYSPPGAVFATEE